MATIVTSSLSATVIQTIGTDTVTFGSNSITSSPFTVGSSDQVVVSSFYLDAAGFSDTPTITYGGVAATGFIKDQRGLLAYWYNPSTAADQTVFFIDPPLGAAILLNTWVIDGVDTSVPAVGNVGDSITAFPAGGDPTNGFFITQAAFSNGATLFSPTAGSPLDSPLDFPASNFENNPGGGVIAGGSVEVATADPLTLAWDESDNVGEPLAYVFAQIPEPSSSAFLALSVLGFVSCRKRQK